MPVSASDSRFLPSNFPSSIPFWLWLLAFAAGVALAAGSLNYAPNGRLNILWLWLLWAGLPLLGSLASLLALVAGRGQPWLFRWRQQRLQWHPSPAERARMLLILQQLWLVLGAGLLLTYLALLVFADLAFGWSSTLIARPEQIAGLLQVVAAPWVWVWPSAAPTLELIDATRYLRIDPGAGETQRAGDWWQFLLASLLVYNLLPRLLIAALIALGLRWRGQQQVQVRAPALTKAPIASASATEDLLANWQTAPVLGWEITDLSPVASPLSAPLALRLGLAAWQQDEQAFKQFLDTAPERLCWQVNAQRSPVAELSDLIHMARQTGVRQQALFVITPTATAPERHIASWRAFASRQQLVWLQASR
jgi:hypothetical protein